MRLVAAVAIAFVVMAVGAALPEAGDEPSAAARSAYFAVGVELSSVERAARHQRLAEEASSAGDNDVATRHLVMSCYYVSAQAWDATLSAPICERARARVADVGPLDARVMLLAIQGNLLAWRLDVVEAMARLGEALELAADLDPAEPDAYGARSARFTRGALLLELGRWDAALDDLDAVRRDASAAGDAALVAWADTWTCRAHLLLGAVDRARERCAAARSYVDRTRDAQVAITLPWMEGDLEDAEGRHAEALAHYRDGWARAAAPGGEVVRATFALSIAHELVVLGLIEEAAGWIADLERAIATGELHARAAPQVDRQRGRLELARGDVPAAVVAFERAAHSPMHGVAILAHRELAQARRVAGDLSGAREAIEQALALIEAGRFETEGAEQRIGYASLHADVYRDLVGLLWDEHGAGASARALAVAEAGRARSLADALALAEAPGVAAPTLAAEEVQATLSDRELLVEFVAGERMFAVAATRENIVFVALPVGADELAQRISFFRQLVIEANDDEAIALPGAALWDDLLAPVLDVLPDGGRSLDTLIVSPDGPLYDLPFDALHNGQTFVAERWRTATVPSASALAARPARAAHGALVIAASPSAGDLEPLPYVRDEATVVQRRVLGAAVRSGPAATEAEAASSGDYAVLHFASHAVIDNGHPLRSALVMSGGAGADGWWRAEEIYSTHLAADLVVLSACRTALGRLSRGEGPMSLSRAFLHAGAQATIATLWDIDDPVGPTFSDEMYAQLGRGAPLVEAVAGARRALRASGAPPRAWAAYVLTGPPRGHVRIEARAAGTNRWPGATMLGLCAFAVLAGVLLLGLRARASSNGAKKG